MNDEEKLLFHRHGFLVFRNLLTAEQVARLNAIADQRVSLPEDCRDQYREFFVCKWGKEYMDLIDHPTILPYLEEFVGPTFRLDHDYCIFMNKGCKGGRLHGGESGFSDFWYRRLPQGTIRSGLTVLTFFLTDAAKGDGGFVVIPGSHRENFLADLPEDVLYSRTIPEYVEQPEFRAGDAVLFAEGVIHGTAPWKAEHQRRVLLYKYCPGHVAWLGNYYDASQMGELSNRQRQILRPPYVDMIQPPNGCYRSKTLAD